MKRKSGVPLEEVCWTVPILPLYLSFSKHRQASMFRTLLLCFKYHVGHSRPQWPNEETTGRCRIWILINFLSRPHTCSMPSVQGWGVASPLRTLSSVATLFSVWFQYTGAQLEMPCVFIMLAFQLEGTSVPSNLSPLRDRASNFALFRPLSVSLP